MKSSRHLFSFWQFFNKYLAPVDGYCKMTEPIDLKSSIKEYLPVYLLVTGENLVKYLVISYLLLSF